jgi:hypothetical protein
MKATEGMMQHYREMVKTDWVRLLDACDNLRSLGSIRN